ncbi:MAG: hypothetical protein KGL57_03045 [Burkholderiales bacterium]|nr:hypothetical protein [Burkholderiales bacterium]
MPTTPFALARPRPTLTARLHALSVLMGVALTACGGGGGGGGGSSSDSSTTAPSTTVSVGAGFPLGVSVHSPTALSGSTLAYAQGSSLVTAITEGTQSLDSSMVNVAGLFDPAYLAHAHCYGPSVPYSHHDDAPSAPDGSLVSGDVAMWTDDDTATTGSPACSVAELDAELGPITTQTRQGLLLAAALRRAATTNGSGTLPDLGATRDLTAPLAAQLASLLPGVTLQTATITSVSDTSQYIYRLVLRRGSGTSAESLEVVVQHTPNDTSEHFAGVLQLTHSHLTASTSYGCTDAVDSGTGLFQVAHVTSLGYNRYDDNLSNRLRSAQFCGAPANGSSSFFGDVATPSLSGEMDPTVFLDATGRRNSTLGWKRELLRYSADVSLSALSGDHVQSWQNTPQDGHGRLFLVHDSGSGANHTAQVFHGFGGDLSVGDGTLSGLYCNWAGPGASHTTITSAFQSQTLALNGGRWNRVSSTIHYAPTNSCSASSTMRFDANGDGTLGTSEGASAANGLDRPSGGRDVQGEAVERGYWAPTLY